MCVCVFVYLSWLIVFVLLHSCEIKYIYLFNFRSFSDYVLGFKNVVMQECYDSLSKSP